MPLYEYLCGNCQTKFDLIRKISDQSAVHCPNCNSIETAKVTSIPSFHLKGGGWYKDGYATNQAPDKVETATAKTDAAPAKKEQETKKDAPKAEKTKQDTPPKNTPSSPVKSDS